MKILIIGPYGIGNNIISLPMFEKLRELFPNTEIDVLTLLQSANEVLHEFKQFKKLFNNIYYLDNLKTVWRLRQKKYNFSILAFPSARFHYNMLSFLIHAKKRIGTKYPDEFFFRGGFLNTYCVPVEIGIHDVYQNLNLLKIFNFNYRKIKVKDNIANDRLKKKKNIIGIHPGSKKSGSFKRWDENSFIKLIKLINVRFNKYKIRLFFGPEEEDNALFFKDELRDVKPEIIINKPIKRVIKEIDECKFFISNDSGLMHLSVFLGCFSISIMGPSDFRRTGPFSDNKIIIYNKIKCRPCSHTYFVSSHKFKCKYSTRRCLDAIKPEYVFKRISKFLMRK